jgi:hypothetical protein
VFAFVLAAFSAKDAKVAALQAENAQLKGDLANALANDAADDAADEAKIVEATAARKVAESALAAQQVAESDLAAAKTELSQFGGDADGLLVRFAAAIGYTADVPVPPDAVESAPTP